MRCECKYPRGGGYTMHMLLGIPVVKCDVYIYMQAMLCGSEEYNVMYCV